MIVNSAFRIISLKDQCASAALWHQKIEGCELAHLTTITSYMSCSCFSHRDVHFPLRFSFPHFPFFLSWVRQIYYELILTDLKWTSNNDHAAYWSTWNDALQTVYTNVYKILLWCCGEDNQWSHLSNKLLIFNVK